jgi:CheY-like chemotaxis protein
VLACAPDDAAHRELCVLVADDSDLLVRLVAEWLEDEGYIPMVATTGRRALDMALLQPPDVALVDLVMPPPDGFEVCDVLLRLPSPPEIILMTGLSDPSRLQRAAERNVAALLRKPFEQEMLLEAVKRAANRRRERTRTLTADHGH